MHAVLSLHTFSDIDGGMMIVHRLNLEPNLIALMKIISIPDDPAGAKTKIGAIGTANSSGAAFSTI